MHGAHGSSSHSRAHTLPAFSLSSVSCRRWLGALLLLDLRESGLESVGGGVRVAILESMAVDAVGRKIDHGATGMESRICVSVGNKIGCKWIFQNQALLPNTLLWTTIFSFSRCRSKIVRECRR